MFDVNTIPISERVHITKNLLRWGITVDQDTGKIDYIEGTVIPEIKCESMHLIRHAETVAVAKHEFMSDTSDNCGFTDIGVEITHKQAKELDEYNFDVALYGPIPRVVHTKELIMQTPQKFEAFKVHKLHGIDNTGWEYKSFDELQNNPTFIAREMENNMFARTSSGTSWGMVIANCVDVIDLINEQYAGKKILLISQGSVLRAMQILLRKRKRPWDDFTVEGMYHVGDDTNKKKNYGVIAKVF
ncbi:MAG: phosphoglycerate mutase family protein [Ruminococcaceae bacterium]|nr:phosphoglycerate mutase family protein [Oscillospiraceae bacterium]